MPDKHRFHSLGGIKGYNKFFTEFFGVIGQRIIDDRSLIADATIRAGVRITGNIRYCFSEKGTAVDLFANK